MLLESRSLPTKVIEMLKLDRDLIPKWFQIVLNLLVKLFPWKFYPGVGVGRLGGCLAQVGHRTPKGSEILEQVGEIGANLESRWAKLEPSWRQDGPILRQYGQLGAPLAAAWHKMGSRRESKRSF